MAFICRSCGKHFQNSDLKKWAKYCPACQKQAYLLRCQKRNSAQRDARRRRAVLNTGPAHGLDLDTVLRELDRFNAQRRAEGRSSISYGRYVAMRDGYLHIEGPEPAIRQPSNAAFEKGEQTPPEFRQRKRRERDGKRNAA